MLRDIICKLFPRITIHWKNFSGAFYWNKQWALRRANDAIKVSAISFKLKILIDIRYGLCIFMHRTLTLKISIYCLTDKKGSQTFYSLDHLCSFYNITCICVQIAHFYILEGLLNRLRTKFITYLIQEFWAMQDIFLYHT